MRNADFATFDIHDRVNYSVSKSGLTVSEDRKSVLLSLTVETAYSSVMDYFEIFLDRMVLCRKAAQTLGLTFRLEINGHSML